MTSTRFLQIGIVLLGLLTLAGQAPAQTCVESPAGLVGWWPGDGDETDVEGGADAKLMNGAGFAPGLVGDAFALDGVEGGQDDRVVFSRMAVDGLADLSIEFWVNTTDVRGALVSGANGNERGANELLMIQNANGLVVWLKQTSSGTLPVFVNDGAWHHMAFVRAGGIGTLYVDGRMAHSRPYPEGPLEIGPRGLLIGQDQDCLAGCFETEQALDGIVDEMAVYGRALGQDEILAVFDAGAAGRCKPPQDDPAGDVMLDRVESVEFEIDALIVRLAELEAEINALQTTPPDPQMKRPHLWRHDHRKDDREDDDDRRRHRGKKFRRR